MSRADATAPDSKKRRILDAARALLVKRGYQDFVLDDVARQAGVAKGTLFLYFRSKDQLFAAAFADLVDSLGESLDELLTGPLAGRALLEATVRAILGHFERNRDFMASAGGGKFPGCGDRSNGRLMGKMSRNVERLARVLARCAKDGLLAPRDRGFLPFAVFGLCRSASFQDVLSLRPKTLSSKVRSVVDLLLEGAAR